MGSEPDPDVTDVHNAERLKRFSVPERPTVKLVTFTDKEVLWFCKTYEPIFTPMALGLPV